MDSLVSGGCIVSGALVRRSVLFSGVRIETGSVVEQSLLLQNVSIDRDCRIHKAIIGENCVIPDGAKIGIDSEHDRELITAATRV